MRTEEYRGENVWIQEITIKSKRTPEREGVTKCIRENTGVSLR